MAMNDKQREMIDERNWLNSSIIIEVQGNDSDYTKGSLERLIGKLNGENGVEVYETNYDEVRKIKDKWFSCSVEAKLVAKDYGLLSKIALLYSPSVFEILEPKKELKVPIGEAQNILADISHTVTKLAHTVFAQQSELNRLAKAEKPSKNNTES